MNARDFFAIAFACLVVSSTLTVGVTAAQSGSTTLDTADALSQWDGKTTRFTASMFGSSGFEATDRVITHGAGLPGWYVGYDTEDEDAFANIETWIGSSDDRRLLYHDQDSGLALVAAPGDHIRRTSLGGWNADGLSTRAYVEYIEVEQRVERVDPVNLETVESVETKHGPTRTENLIAAFNGGDYGVESDARSGVAFDGDVNRTNMSGVKKTIAADSSSIPSTADGSNVTIAVLDTGANVENGEVFGNGSTGSEIRIKHGKNFITGDSINTTAGDYSAISDGNLHGTYTAARIAGAGAGSDELRSPAYKSDLAVAKVLDDEGSGSIQNIIEGLEWAASDDVDADVVSMSLGAPTYSKALEDTIHSSLEEGGVSAITVAAGNSRWTWGRANLGSPADAEGVISVAATSTGSPDNISSAYFSNTGDDGGFVDGSNGETRGERPDVGTPGMKNTVLLVDSSGLSNATMSGTSMSTPDVAAAAALLVDEEPTLEGDHAAVRDRLLETSSPAKNVGVSEIGNGVLNVSNALDDTRPELDQESARTEQAIARDNANFGLTGRFGMFLRQRGVGV